MFLKKPRCIRSTHGDNISWPFLIGTPNFFLVKWTQSRSTNESYSGTIVEMQSGVRKESEGIYPQRSEAVTETWRQFENENIGPSARINIQTEIVNGERGHYLVWSVRVKG